MRALLLLIAVFGLAACGEKPQVVVYKQGKYQGKPDTRPWDNAPAGQALRGGQWTKGDRATWEEQLKQRQLAQNEYKRIGQ